MRPGFTLVLLALLGFQSTVAQDCSAASKTLTTSCGNDICGAYEPCLAYNSSDCFSSGLTDSSSNCTIVGDDACEYKCFQAFGAYNSDPTQFVFIVPYDEQDENNDGIYATANNDVVTAIDQLTLSPQTTNVWIQGGGVYQQISKGRVIELELADNLLTSQSQVTSVSLVAMNLSTKIHDIPNMVASSITTLSLSNTLLMEFTPHLVSLTSVVTLHLDNNYITTVDSSIIWDKLIVLNLNQNNLVTFEGNFPALTDLYLNGNNLTEIPAIVFTFQHLTKLSIQNNLLTTRTFTESQITFLQGLSNFDIAENNFQGGADCSVPEQRVVGANNVVVCVSNLITSLTSSAASSSSTSSSASSDLPTSRMSYSSGSNSMDNDHSSSSADQTGSLLVVAIIMTFVVLAALIATAIYYWKQHNKEKTHSVYNNMNRGSTKQRAMAIWNDLDLEALQLNCGDIQDIRVIGSGAFAVVWLVRYRNSALLASKRLREDAVVTERTQAFVEEIKLVSQLDHPNIVTFIGTAWTTGSDIQALFEFIENGDLCTYLSPSLPRYWTRVKLQLAVDVIEALVYVHAFTPPLVHRDLKSQNVLISADMQAKLTDFGVSRFQSTNDTMTMGIGTNRWLAPEVISGSGDYDESADIFALGVLLSEFDTHTLPYDDVVDNNGNRLEDVTILQMVASGTLRPTFSDTCPPIILELAKQCMAQEPHDRPPALKVAYALRTLQREAFNM